MFGLAAIPAVVRFIAFFFLPESPRWLVGKGRVEAAQRVLGRLRGGGSDDEVEKELSEIRNDLEQSAENNSKSKSVSVTYKLYIRSNLTTVQNHSVF